MGDLCKTRNNTWESLTSLPLWCKHTRKQPHVTPLSYFSALPHLRWGSFVLPGSCSKATFLPSKTRQGEDPLRLRDTKSYMTYNYYKDSGRKRYWLVSHGSGDWLESHCCCCSKLLIKKQTTTMYNSLMAFHCARSVHCSATLPTGCRDSTWHAPYEMSPVY